jgi:hypothetical protein
MSSSKLLLLFLMKFLASDHSIHTHIQNECTASAELPLELPWRLQELINHMDISNTEASKPEDKVSGIVFELPHT